jgi:molybdate transport system substrate-binding protein
VPARVRHGPNRKDRGGGVALNRRLLLILVALLPGPALAAPGKEVVVFAASSLKELFGELGSVFEKAHPGVRVRLSLAGTQELRIQIEQGATADVFAAADLKHMDALGKAGLVGRPSLFARNEPVMVVPHGNPAGVRSVADLSRTKRLVIGVPDVPIGSYTVKIFDAAGRKLGPELRAKLEAAVVSRELNVRQVLAKVTLGEADAGIVYRTDALAAKDRVDVIPIAPDLNVMAEYPIATVSASKESALAQELVRLVLSAEGQRRVAAAGFVPVGDARAEKATIQVLAH